MMFLWLVIKTRTQLLIPFHSSFHRTCTSSFFINKNNENDCDIWLKWLEMLNFFVAVWLLARFPGVPELGCFFKNASNEWISSRVFFDSFDQQHGPVGNNVPKSKIQLRMITRSYRRWILHSNRMNHIFAPTFFLGYLFPSGTCGFVLQCTSATT